MDDEIYRDSVENEDENGIRHHYFKTLRAWKHGGEESPSFGEVYSAGWKYFCKHPFDFFPDTIKRLLE